MLRNHSGTFTMTFVLVAWMALLGTNTANAQRADAASQLESSVIALSTEAGQRIGPYRIAAPQFITRFYKARDYRPAWVNGENILALTAAIAEAPLDGLLVRDFHPEAIGLSDREANVVLTPAERDIVLTDAFVRLLYQLHYGKVSPQRLDKDWNLRRKNTKQSADVLISEALDNGQVAALVARARPQGFRYKLMRNVLSVYRGYAQRGGWPTLADGPVLKPGAQDPRIPILRQRLTITGVLTSSAIGAEDIYDAPLLEALKAFQLQHGLDVDGVLGPASIRALNVSASDRVEQIRVNMERARWFSEPLKDLRDLVIVNTAGFYLLTILDGEFVWWTNVITGKPYHKTPQFIDSIKYVEFNPTWTIPGGILRNEILPKLKANANYLVEKGYDLINSNGQKVNSTSIDWNTVSARSFPYRVVQPPGPKNSLGLVKFMFPNKHNVYLHDTPNRTLFSKTGRAFSHGCVRVKDPMKFAEVLLNNRNGVTRSKIDSIVGSQKLTRVKLSKPIKVAILYWTVDPVWEGGIRFYEDVYKRDGKILKALNAKFRPTPD